MPYKKICFVPRCKNNSVSNPALLFTIVQPSKKEEWFKAVKRILPSQKTVYFCCEDHFNMKTDCKMFWRSKQLMRMNDHVSPRFLINRSHLVDPSVINQTKKETEPHDARELENIETENIPDGGYGNTNSEAAETGDNYSSNNIQSPLTNQKNKLKSQEAEILETKRGRPKRSTPFKKHWLTTKQKLNSPTSKNTFEASKEIKYELLDNDNDNDLITSVTCADIGKQEPEKRRKRSTPFKKLWLTISDEEEDDSDLSWGERRPKSRNSKKQRLTVENPGTNKEHFDEPLKKRRGRPPKNKVHGLPVKTATECLVSSPAVEMKDAHSYILDQQEIKTELNEEFKVECVSDSEYTPHVKTEIADKTNGINFDQNDTSGLTFGEYANMNSNDRYRLISNDENLNAVKADTKLEEITLTEPNTEMPEERTSSVTSDFEVVLIGDDDEGKADLAKSDSILAGTEQKDSVYLMEYEIEQNCDMKSANLQPPPLNHLQPNPNNVLNSSEHNLPSPPMLQPIFSVLPVIPKNDTDVAKNNNYSVSIDAEPEVVDISRVDSEQEIDLTHLSALLKDILPHPWLVSNGPSGLHIIKVEENSIGVAYVSIDLSITSNSKISVSALGKILPSNHYIFLVGAENLSFPTEISLTCVLELLDNLLNTCVCKGLGSTEVSTALPASSLRTYRSKKCLLLSNDDTCPACSTSLSNMRDTERSFENVSLRTVETQQSKKDDAIYSKKTDAMAKINEAKVQESSGSIIQNLPYKSVSKRRLLCPAANVDHSKTKLESKESEAASSFRNKPENNRTLHKEGIHETSESAAQNLPYKSVSKRRLLCPATKTKLESKESEAASSFCNKQENERILTKDRIHKTSKSIAQNLPATYVAHSTTKLESKKTDATNSSPDRHENDRTLNKEETLKLMGLTSINNIAMNVRKSSRERRSTMKEHWLKNQKNFIESNFETLLTLFSTRLFWGPYLNMSRQNLLNAFSEVNLMIKRWHQLLESDPTMFCGQTIPKVKGDEELEKMSNQDLKDKLTAIVRDLIDLKCSFKEHFPKFVKLYRNHKRNKKGGRKASKDDSKTISPCTSKQAE